MRIAIYGGSFDPPHLGHIKAAETAEKVLAPDRLMIIPVCIPPHKEPAAGSPTAEQRMGLCRRAFSGIPHTEVSDLEIRRGGKSFTCDTVEQLRSDFPDADIFLVIGSDMLMCFETWRDSRFLLENCTLAVLTRLREGNGELASKAGMLRDRFGARVVIVPHEPVETSSEEVRRKLMCRAGTDRLSEAVYSDIIRHRFYGAKPDLNWLRAQVMPMIDEKRRAHVLGCEKEAVRLAERWGEDPELAAEAAILHDITKKLTASEQLNLCEKYGIIIANSGRQNYRLLHAVTGAALAGDLFGADETVCEAIRCHTTGKPGMTQVEKILYLADYIEPTREFDGIDELRQLSFQDIDAAMALGLKMTVDEVKRSGFELCTDTLDAYEWFIRKGEMKTC